MSTVLDQQFEPKTFTVTRSQVGYAHKSIWGTFTGHITPDDVAAEFFRPYIGGRDIQIDRKAKTFFAIVHTS